MRWKCLLFLPFFFLACNNDDSAGPYDEVLVAAPYSGITDSIRQSPKDPELYFRRAVLLNKNGLMDPALLDFRKAWSIAREERYAVGVANILIEKRADSTLPFMEEAVKALPESMYLQLTLARIYQEKNQPDKALEICRRILASEPEQVNTLILQADILESKKDTTGMIASLEKAYLLLPGNLELGHRLAYQYAESGNPRALTLADSLVLRDPQHIFAEPFYIKGNYYANTGDQAKAIQAFNQAISRDHRYLNAYIEKGKIFLKQKKTAEAMSTFKLANTINPAFADAWYWMGRCQEISGQPEDARLNYEKAYSLDKNFAEAKEALDQLSK